MKKFFGRLPSGEQASLYTISCGRLTAAVTDYGAHLVSLLVPDREGNRDFWRWHGINDVKIMTTDRPGDSDGYQWGVSVQNPVS